MKAPQDNKPGPVVKPLVMIVTFMALGIALLVTMDALGSGTTRIDWSWVLYGVGAVALFLVFTLRARSRRGQSEIIEPTEPEVERTDEDGPAEESIEDVRARIQRRKRGES